MAVPSRLGETRGLTAEENLGPRDWVDDAACRGINTELFFQTEGTRDPAELRAVKRLCDRCPVQLDCLAYGLAEPSGVWGGATPHERWLLVNLSTHRTRALTYSTWLRRFIETKERALERMQNRAGVASRALPPVASNEEVA